MDFPIAMPDANTFLSRAWAYDPLISMSLLPPKNAWLDETKPRLSTSGSYPHPSESESPQLEDTNKDLEISDLDLPSSEVDEIEVVRSQNFNLVCTKLTRLGPIILDNHASAIRVAITSTTT